MAAPKFKVMYQDGKIVEVRVTPRAQVEFERHFNLTMSSLSTNPSAQHGYWLAWRALHCAGMEGREFDAFLDVIEEIEAIEGDGEDPTNPGPGPGDSSN